MSEELNDLYLDYWTTLRDRFESFDPPFEPGPPPTGQSRGLYPLIWCSWVKLEAGCSAKLKTVRAQVALVADDAKPRYAAIESKKARLNAAIRKHVGTDDTIEWITPRPQIPRMKVGFVRIERCDCDVTKRSEWPEQHDWLSRRLIALHQVYREIMPRTL